MTVLVAIAVKPENGLNPYFLIGTDSLRVNKFPIYSADGEIVDYEIDSRDEDSEKIFEVNDKLVGMTGYFNVELTEMLIKYLRENDRDIRKLSGLALKFVKNFILNDDSLLNQRCTLTIGSCENSKPIISFIEVDNKDLNKARYSLLEPSHLNAVPVFAGNTKETDDLQKLFLTRVRNSINLNSAVIKKAAIEYLKNAADRHPQTCNQNIKIKILK